MLYKLIFDCMEIIRSTVVMSACFQSGRFQAHFNAGDMIDNIIISIESAIHASPVMRDNFT